MLLLELKKRLTFIPQAQKRAFRLFIFFAFLFPALSFGQDNNENGEVLFIETANPKQSLPMSEELKITIHDDPSGFSDDPETKKIEVLKKLKDLVGKSVTPNEKGLAFPMAPSQSELLESLNNLSETELDLFLDRREKIIDKFAKSLKFMRAKNSIVNAALIDLNDKLYNSSQLIAKANAYSGNATFLLNGGLALPQKLVKSLKETKYGRFIPENGGFYYCLGLGAGVARANVSGKNVLNLELYLDYEHLKKSITGAIEAGVAGNYGFVYELREPHTFLQEGHVSYAGVLGAFRDGPQQFGWAASTGLSVPPLIGSILLFQNAAHRYYLVRINRMGISFPVLNSFREFLWQQVRRSLNWIKSCRNLWKN